MVARQCSVFWVQNINVSKPMGSRVGDQVSDIYKLYIIMEWFCNYDASMMEHG